MPDLPIPLGTSIKPWGRVESVALIEGERYYFCRDGHGTVSMIPAADIPSPTPQESDQY